MARKRKPVFTDLDLKAHQILDRKSDEDILLDKIAELSVPVQVSLSSERHPFSELWKQYGVTIPGKRLQELTGYDQSAYTKARRGEKKIRYDKLIAACLVSRVTVQQACDIFHLCRDVSELASYPYESAVLVYFLNDMEHGGETHNYDELIRYTMLLRQRDALDLMPAIHNRQKRWQEMQAHIESGTTTFNNWE